MAQQSPRLSSHRDVDWTIFTSQNGTVTYTQVQCFLLADIRAELKRLNNLLACARFQNIPNQLEALAKVARRSNARHDAVAKKRRKAIRAA